MDFIHDRKSNIVFSLLGSRVNEIKFHNKILTLKVDRIFQYEENEEKEYPGEICFNNCDLNMCSVVIFNKTLGKGYFNGKAIYLQEFIDKPELFMSI